MEAIQPDLQLIAQHLGHIKWLFASILFLVIITAGIAVFLLYRFTKAANKTFTEETLSKNLRDLLDKNEIDEVIQLANERIKTHPKDAYAHWYLGQAYYRKNEYFKSLEEFRILNELSPAWREDYVTPYIENLKERIKEFKPEIVKD